ncbi:DNA-repair protein [Nosema bombycis CQ1]|uniref:DNA-repair protein n=1 Tax=Nosema bombycis (strain CQ1 / CVCC 102059) TaxID=578461 RepID=R0KPI8_NOSB1|nr:DNA-repair protein [Nosema bombycis CQ1]|eukprot:EOB12102.1 DNA-repair protein [Nosema bombycis CQ1]
MDEDECGFFTSQITKEKKIMNDVELSFPIEKSNTCKYCESAHLDPEIINIFKISTCKQCRYSKMKFITKTTATKEYLLDNYELKCLKYLSRPNPHKGTWHDMHLYLEDEIVEIAKKKYGDLEKIEEIKSQREEVVTKRKIKNLQNRVRDLKRRTITKETKIERHIHNFIGEGSIKQCTGCGLKVEQEQI